MTTITNMIKGNFLLADSIDKSICLFETDSIINRK